jgi:hypothetical protein
MTTREQIMTVLEGGVPDKTPYIMYDGMMDGKWNGLPQGAALEPWLSLLDSGLGVMQHCNIFKKIEHGAKRTYEKKISGSDICEFNRIETPVGILESRRLNGWHDGKWIHDEKDYQVMKWLVENTEIIPNYERFEEFESKIGNYGVTVTEAFRTPMQTINIDLAGTERFCMDFGLEVPGLFELYDALHKQFMTIIDVLANCRGRYVKVLENPTMSLLGPGYYRQWLLPVYHEMLNKLPDKRVMMHFDSELSCVEDLVAVSPFQMIESLTEPPEGDMLYDECRTVWPDKVLLCNINVGLYALPPDQLRQAVEGKIQRLGKKGMLFEISEDLPGNWRECIPVVLDVLNKI